MLRCEAYDVLVFYTQIGNTAALGSLHDHFTNLPGCCLLDSVSSDQSMSSTGRDKSASAPAR